MTERSRRTAMTAKTGLEKTISNSLIKQYQPCPELQGLLAKNKGKFKVPIIAEMLQAIPWECQRYLIERYGEFFPEVEGSIFNPIAKEWFSARPAAAMHGRYSLINDLKGMLKLWGFHDFYEQHKDVLAVNMNDELFTQLNVYYCLDEAFESHINRTHEKASKKKVLSGVSIKAYVSADPRPEMTAMTAKTFFLSSMLNLQLKWMLELMDLAYIDGSMGAGLDSEEYEKFQNLHQAINVPTVDALIDNLEMFPPHVSNESTTALRFLLKNAENEITQKVRAGRQNVLRKKGN
jgi:hypothetical protein